MNQEQDQGHLGNALIYEDYVPLFAVALSGGDAPALVANHQLELQNLNTLRMLWYMQESFHELPEHYHELLPVFQRLDNKIDMLMQMVGQVVSQSVQLPRSTRIRLCSTKMSWLSPSQVELSTKWKIECYLLASIPIPLTIVGNVLAVRPEGEHFWIDVELEPLGEQLSDLLDKIIFRAHRRAVAKQRHAGDSHS